LPNHAFLTRQIQSQGAASRTDDFFVRLVNFERGATPSEERDNNLILGDLRLFVHTCHVLCQQWPGLASGRDKQNQSKEY
jgi:hypothetical protein